MNRRDFGRAVVTSAMVISSAPLLGSEVVLPRYRPHFCGDCGNDFLFNDEPVQEAYGRSTSPNERRMHVCCGCWVYSLYPGLWRSDIIHSITNGPTWAGFSPEVRYFDWFNTSRIPELAARRAKEEESTKQWYEQHPEVPKPMYFMH